MVSSTLEYILSTLALQIECQSKKNKQKKKIKNKPKQKKNLLMQNSKETVHILISFQTIMLLSQQNAM